MDDFQIDAAGWSFLDDPAGYIERNPADSRSSR
jgi:hypothetical protein